MTWIKDHKVATALGGALLLIALGYLAFYWFGFQTALIDERVDEAAPGLSNPTDVPSALAAPSGGALPDADAEREAEPEPTGPVTLSSERFRDLAHHTSGRALLIELPDGSQVVRLEDLDTLNGPDLKVYLSDAPAGGADDRFDDDYASLGPLKGNQGNQNYPVPRNVDADAFRSIVIWCERFSVGFGVAELRA